MMVKIVALIVAAILVLGGGYLLLNKNSSKPVVTKNITSMSPSPTPSGMTMAQLLASGENRKCTFDTKTANSETKGVIYVSKLNAKGDFEITTKTKTESDHILRIGDVNYIWGDTFPTGIKMKLSVSDLSKNQQASQAFNPTQKTNFNCTNWTVDASLFTPPANIRFTDMTSFMLPSSSPTSTSSSGSGVNCSTCNSLTGSAKTSCLSALHC